MSEDRYVSRKEAGKSYRPRSYVMSPGLLRARAPFRIQNALTGLVLAGFATAVWAYSIRAVKQDDFSDVDEEAREMMSGRALTAGMGDDVGEQSTSAVAGVGARPLERGESSVNAATDTGRIPSRPRGILAPALDRAFPHLLDPTRKTLVWGAPPIDDLGRVRVGGDRAHPNTMV